MRTKWLERLLIIVGIISIGFIVVRLAAEFQSQILGISLTSEQDIVSVSKATTDRQPTETDLDFPQTATTNPTVPPPAYQNISSLESAPEFTLRSLAGDMVSLSDFAGHTVMINFWATWCGPCRFEMPAIEDVFRRHKDNGFMVLAVNFQESDSVVEPFVSELALSFPILMDEAGDIMQLYGVLGLPTSVFVNGDGLVYYRQVGPMSEEQIEGILQEMTVSS